MNWLVEYTNEFGEWWEDLKENEQNSVAAYVQMLEVHGPSLTYPYCSGITGSRYSHMPELRVQHQGRPYRVLYAFDPRRAAILLIGGDKTGNDQWYAEYVPVADELYDEHLQSLRKEGLL